jgi:hypothetical protein
VTLREGALSLFTAVLNSFITIDVWFWAAVAAIAAVTVARNVMTSPSVLHRCTITDGSASSVSISASTSSTFGNPHLYTQPLPQQLDVLKNLIYLFEVIVRHNKSTDCSRKIPTNGVATAMLDSTCITHNGKCVIRTKQSEHVKIRADGALTSVHSQSRNTVA